MIEQRDAKLMKTLTIDLTRTAAMASLLVSAALLLCASAASAEVCRNPDQSVGRTIHDTLVHNPSIFIEKFVGADAQAGIAAYNRLPEPGHDRGDTFYIAFDVRSHTSFMAVSQGDCLVSNGFWLEPAGVAVRLAIEKSRGQPL
jgi:hypothetical protein